MLSYLRTDLSVRLEVALDLVQKMSQLDEMDRKILDVAQQEFMRKGYYRASVDEMADLLGIGKGTIYRHFGSKALLFAAVLIDLFQKATKGIEEVLEVKDSLEAFDLFCDKIVKSAHEGHFMKQSFSTEEMGIFMREMKSKEDFRQIGSAMVKMRTAMSGVLVRILESGRKTKVFAGAWSPVVTAEIILRILTNAGNLTACSDNGIPGMHQTHPDINDTKKFIIRSITDENK